ncbi:MAG TPA: AAA family ATPase, partial [Gammaproteobacteria bacterium]|nr:AAA family ATPase [Gammaproteobacteria bacterium]
LDFGEHLARFHADLPALPNTVPPHEEAATVIRAVVDNLRELGELAKDAALLDQLKTIRTWTERQCAAIEPVVARRLGGQAHKECHGDLHLENLLVLRGKILAFDALEFDPALREIDVISEASFLAMDLLAHGRPDLAYGFLTRYLETGGDYDGIEVLRFYLVYRAMIRAKVRAIKVAQAGAGMNDRNELVPYFEVAGDLIRARRPLLLITHGLSGSGKTHITNALIGRLPALRVRSDLERKRLHGLGADAASGSGVGAGLYAADSSKQTYARLYEVGDWALSNQFNVIVDATFLRHDERRAFRRLAQERDARFAILDCVAPAGVLRKRIAHRAAGRQASEATRQVLDYQLANQDPLDAAERAVAITLDTQGAVDYEQLIVQLSAR